MSIDIQGFSVRYIGQDGPLPPALSGIDVAIEDGSTVLITGPSGCGKTTLLRSINALIPCFYDADVSGSILIDSVPVADRGPSQMADSVGYVFQDPRSEFFTFSVRSELAFPCENIGLPADRIRRRIEDVSSLVGIENLLDMPLATLSSGEKQKIAIACALMLRPRIVLFDEPSANLDAEGLDMLRTVLRRLRSEGMTLIIADHRLHYLTGILDRCLILRDGRIEEDLDVQTLTSRSAEWFSQRGLRFPEAPTLDCEPVAPPQEEPVDTGVRIRSADFAYPSRPLLWSIDDLLLPPSGVIGITGANGAGKTTLVNLILGVLGCRGAEFTLAGAAWRRRTRTRDCALVMQDVEYQLLGESIDAEMTLGVGDTPANRTRATRLLERVGLGDCGDRHPLTLSGGQKQRLGIALACMKGARVTCLDEPTSGLDAANMRRVAALIRSLADEGALVLVITHDAEFAALAFDHTIRIENGRIRLERVIQTPSDSTATTRQGAPHEQH